MKDIAKSLLDIQAIFLRPNDFFTFTSGLKSPIYCDNRLTFSFPSARKKIIDGMVKVIKEKYPDVEAVVGVATAGIQHASLVATNLNLPMAYIRNSIKKYGRSNLIEGQINPNTKVVVIEDLISTGKSTIEAVQNLRKANINVLGALAIFTYQLPLAIDNFKKAEIKYETLTNFSELITTAVEEKYIEEKDVEIVMKWKKDFNLR